MAPLPAVSREVIENEVIKTDPIRRRGACFTLNHSAAWTYFHMRENIWYFEHWERGLLIERLRSHDVSDLTYRFVKVVDDIATKIRITKAPYVNRNHLPNGKRLKGIRTFDPAIPVQGKSILPFDR